MNKIWTPKIILPDILAADERFSSARSALEYQLRLLSEAAKECLFLPRIDILPEELIDVLAEQYHVDFYEPLSMDIETKRAFVRDAILWHRIKGTPQAVEKVVARSFAYSEVKEWFEYGGEPYFFRIYADLNNDDEPVTRDVMDRLRKAVYESKNARSWLEHYRFSFDSEDTIARPTDEYTMCVQPHVLDQYDYGQIDYRLDGGLMYDGEVGYGGITGGSFEMWSEHVTVQWDQSVEVDDPFIGHVHRDFFDSLVPYGELNADLTQIYTRDGTWDYGGEIDYDASVLAADLTLIDSEEQSAWARLQRELETDFKEACTCGSTEYDWCYGSIRLGTERFLITDPQVETVKIVCMKCRDVIAEYVVGDDLWEVFI